MAKDWNKQGFFSGITEDYSNYTWYRGESKNPYQNDQKRPLAAQFWEYERDFHMGYLDRSDTSVSLADAYRQHFLAVALAQLFLGLALSLDV